MYIQEYQNVFLLSLYGVIIFQKPTTSVGGETLYHKAFSQRKKRMKEWGVVALAKNEREKLSESEGRGGGGRFRLGKLSDSEGGGDALGRRCTRVYENGMKKTRNKSIETTLLYKRNFERLTDVFGLK